ncbi:MAG: heat-shock protein Hsp20 [Blastocatellia bacterium AA13]|nr:MAG: heat-shock protein Hsp20 [Blastocatellia bacterium AA13]
MNRVLADAFGARERETSTLSAWTPAVDVYEDEGAYLIKAELPEINKDDVKVSLDKNVLTINGERRLENEEKRDNYHRVERNYGQFFRSFTLPPNVNIEAIAAEFKDGMLKLTLPKKEEAKPKQIEVAVK